MSDRKPQLLVLKNYLTLAKSSIGSKIFRKLYFRIGKRKIDVLRDGGLSCAFLVSATLKIFDLIGEIHTTVKETVKDLKRRGWKPLKKPRRGAIIVYAPKKFKSGEVHKHIGIYIGNGKVISNRDFKKSPKIDRWNYRPVEEILWNKKLQGK